MSLDTCGLEISSQSRDSQSEDRKDMDHQLGKIGEKFLFEDFIGQEHLIYFYIQKRSVPCKISCILLNHAMISTQKFIEDTKHEQIKNKRKMNFWPRIGLCDT